jgi:hypothetical protein
MPPVDIKTRSPVACSLRPFIHTYTPSRFASYPFRTKMDSRKKKKCYPLARNAPHGQSSRWLGSVVDVTSSTLSTPDGITSRYMLGCRREGTTAYVSIYIWVPSNHQATLPSDAGIPVSAVPVRLQSRVKLKGEELRKLVGRRWDCGVIAWLCHTACYRLGVCIL